VHLLSLFLRADAHDAVMFMRESDVDLDRGLHLSQRGDIFGADESRRESGD
jgi:hypothetical protein